MPTLKQLQEKGEEEFDSEFGRYLNYVDDVQGWAEYFTPFTSYRIKDFLHQQTTLAYEAGYEKGITDKKVWNGVYEIAKQETLDTVLKEIDKKLNSIGRPVDGFPKEEYTSDTWVIIGKLEALDTLKNKLLDNKE